MLHAVPAPRFLDVDGLVNARDLGGWPTTDGRRTGFGVVLRSDLPRGPGPVATDALAAAGVRTVVDLRTPAERDRAPGPFAMDTRFAWIAVDLLGPVDAARAEGRLPQERTDLARIYLEVLDVARAQLLDALNVLRDATDRGATLIHCTAGKDRTGMVAALLLRGAGVPSERVAEEYALTHERLMPLRPLLMQGAAELDIPEATYARLLDARPAALRPFLERLDEELLDAARGILPVEDT